jgi:PAS domain S-box-containing protein
MPQESSLFEAMFREHLAVMLLLDPVTLDILDANAAALDFYGWSLGEMLSMNFRQICQGGPECHAQVIEQCRDTGRRVALCRHRVREGQMRDVDIRISRIHVEDRTVLFAIISDITGRVIAERALKESMARLHSITENSTEGIYQSTMEGRFLWVNPALARILGYRSPDELVSTVTDMGTLLYSSPEEWEKLLALLGERGSLERHEVCFRHREGRAIWMAANTWVVRDQSGRALRIEGVVEDITSRKKAESERMLLATAVEQAAEGVVIVTGGTWKVEYANSAFGSITGLDRSCILGQDFFGIFGNARAPLPARDIQQALREGLEWTGQLKGVKPGGKVLSAEAVFSPIRDEAGRVTNAVVLLRDVGYQDRMEKRLGRAHKLEAVGTLAGGIAHDFNNILTPILLNAEVGMQLLGPGDILRRPLEEIIQAGGRARQLIKQILVFSRQGDLRAARINLTPIVRETLRLMRSSLPPDVEVHLEECGEALEVMADPSLVHQMVANLSDNALHAMQGRGGALTISLKRRTVEPGERTAATPLPPGEYAMLAVADTGHGMDQTVMERIFTPFFTTKRPGEGTGMGLSTVYGIARSLGGAVRVESELGQGSLFEVYLPLAGTVPLAAKGGRERRALVVDTQAFSRRALAMILGELGFKATMLRDAPKALKAFVHSPESFDVVLVAEDLHGMSGRSFLLACRKTGRNARLILLIDREEPGSAVGVADAELRRPVSVTDLAKAVAGAGDEAEAAANSRG